jgi:hypothetical protein
MYPKVNRHGVQHPQDQGHSGLKYPMNNPQGVQFQETNSSKKGTSQLEDFKILNNNSSGHSRSNCQHGSPEPNKVKTTIQKKRRAYPLKQPQE